MGERLTGYEPTGGFEAAELMAICESAYPFPSTEPALPEADIVTGLRRYVVNTCAAAARQGSQLAGGKYPHLCAMGGALREVCGGELRVVHIDRPLDESIASLKARSQRASGWLAAGDAEVEHVQRWLWNEKQELLQQVPHVDVTFTDLLAAPRREVNRVVSWLEITPSEEAIARATAHVQPKHLRQTAALWRRALRR